MKQSNKKTLICVLLCALFCAVTAFAFAGCKKTEAAKKYAVIFMDGETQISEQTVEANKEAVKPADPTKESTVGEVYTFAGWSLTDGGETVTDFTIKADTTFYAVYTSSTRQYKVTFMNGSEKLSESDVDYNGVAAAPTQTPAKESTVDTVFAFAGWSLTDGGETVTDFTIKADTTFYAVYTPATRQYKVTFMNGSEKLSESDVDYNGVAVAPAQTPAKESTVDTVYAFAGWSLTDGGEKVDELKITGDTTFYAVYTPSVRKYNVQFIGDDIDVTVSVNARENVPALKDEEGALGRKIVGYYSDEGFGTEFDTEAEILKDTVVYVKLSDYVYFNGAMLNKFTGGNASKTLNADGTFTMGITSGTTARHHQKNINLAMNDTNGFEVRAKLENVSRVDLYLYGQYTLNGTAGAGDNYQHLYRGLSTQGWTTSLPDADGYVTMVYDLAYITDKEPAKDFVYNVIDGFCIDIYGSGSITVDYVKSIKVTRSYTVNYYVNGAVKKTATVKEGEKAIALKDEEGALGRKIVGYYSDEGFGTEFDTEAEILKDTVVYVKLSDYVYFNGAMLNKFTGGNASKTLNADGTFTMGITSGTTARHHQKNINLAMNDTNGFEVRAKLENVSRVDLYLYGQYTLNGTAGAGDNYQHLYRGLSTQGWTTSLPDADGYVTMVYDLAYITDKEPAKDFVYNVIDGFCIDIYGSGSITVDYVKSIKVTRSYTVNYYVNGAVKKTATVKEGEKAIALKDEEGALGRQIVGYYTDAAFTQVFDMANTAITQDTNLYVKLSDYVYFNGAMISKFTGGSATKTLNADGTATIGGDKNGLIAKQSGLNLDLNDTDGIEIKVNGATGRLIDIWVIGDYVKDGVNGTLTAENDAMGYYRGLPTQGYTVTAEDSEGYVIMRFDFAYITNGQGAQNFNFTKMTGLRIDLFGLQSATIAYVKSIQK